MNLAQKTQKGFTLIEMLLVVSLIGILGGIVYAVIDPAYQKAKAVNASRKNTLGETAAAIESYITVHGETPANGTGDMSQLNPFEGTDADEINEFLRKWPEVESGYEYLGSSYYYIYNQVSSSDFTVVVRQATDPTNYFKYSSSWGEIRECGNSANISQLEECPAL